MSSGIYNALSGALAQMQLLDITANNLANANTVGFKKDRTSFETMLKQAGDPTATKQLTFTTLSRTVTDHAPGTIRRTDAPLDLAIEGEGFFRVQGPQGMAYTRHGSFRRDGDGRLLTEAGLPVLGTSGPITLGEGVVTISRNGTITSGGNEVGVLPVYAFEPGVNLEKRGDGLFVPPAGIVPKVLKQPRLQQGGVEMSNVNVLQEMTRMTDGLRAFEAYQKIIKGYGQLGKADELGSVG